MKYGLHILIFFIFSVHFTSAADFSIKPTGEPNDYKVGDEILFEFNLVTENISYNAIEGNLRIDENFTLQQIITGSSVISAWIENPSQSKDNIVNFAGIIAGGYDGTGTIFNLVLTPKKSGELKIFTNNNFVYVNDGNGTKISVPNLQTSINVRELLPEEKNNKFNLKDTTAPENFTVEVLKDNNLQDGKYVLIFSTTDKGSGIKSYEVTEGKKVFKNVSSPYLLVNQKINERMYVKAIDYNGNERVVELNAQKQFCIANICINKKIIVLILAISFMVFLIIWKKQSQSFKKISENIS